MTMIIVMSAIAQIFLSRAFAIANAGTVAIANFTQVMWSYGFGVLFVNEKPTISGILGAFSILVGASVAAFAQARQKKKEQQAKAAGTLARDQTLACAETKTFVLCYDREISGER